MEQIAPLLEDLAAQLGTTVEYLWPMFVAKTKIKYITWLILSHALLAVSSLVLWRSLVAGKRMDWCDETWGPIAAVSGGFTLCFAISSFAALSDLWVLWYPEVRAIENLFVMVGG